MSRRKLRRKDRREGGERKAPRLKLARPLHETTTLSDELLGTNTIDEMHNSTELLESSEHVDVKTIVEYPKEQCVVPGCIHNAVGSSDKCRKHGGDPIIRSNLMKSSEIPSWILEKTKYDPVKHPMYFITASRDGLSEVEIAAEMEVSVGTLRGWSEKFLEFNQAYEIGKAMYESWWLREGKANLDNRSYNVGLFKFLTGNQLGYSDKMESKNLNVSAGVLLVPGQSASIDDWELEGAEVMLGRKADEKAQKS